MDKDALARALAVSSAEATILRCLVIELIARHPQNRSIVEQVERLIAGQQVESARENHYQQFREELRTQWQLYRQLFDEGLSPPGRSSGG